MRRFWLKLHRWAALALGLPLTVVALLGSSLVVLKPLDRQLNAELFSVPVDPSAPDLLERTRRRLRAEFGPDASFVLRPPRQAGESLRAMVRGGPWEGYIYVDPRDARELGRRGEREGCEAALGVLYDTDGTGDWGGHGGNHGGKVRWALVVCVFVLRGISIGADELALPPLFPSPPPPPLRTSTSSPRRRRRAW